MSGAGFKLLGFFLCCRIYSIDAVAWFFYKEISCMSLVEIDALSGRLAH
jgi:hypothetical protein